MENLWRSSASSIRSGGRAQHAHPGLVQLEGQVVGGLPAHGHDNAEGLLSLVDLADRLEGQLLEVQAVALVVVRADGLGVVVDENRLVAELAQGHDGIDAAPVELDGAADTVHPRPEDDDRLSGPRAPRRSRCRCR